MSTGQEPPRLPSLGRLNNLPPAEFASAVRPLFEAAGLLAEVLAAGRPYSSYAEMIQRAELTAMTLPAAAQVDLVNAHPRIGEEPAAVRRQSSLSYREQGYDQEASLPAEEMERVYRELADLNRTYEEHFGFRFVVFVNHRPKSQIVEVLRRRLANSRPAELNTALHELFAIARDRCQHLAAQE